MNDEHTGSLADKARNTGCMRSHMACMRALVSPCTNFISDLFIARPSAFCLSPRSRSEARSFVTASTRLIGRSSFSRRASSLSGSACIHMWNTCPLPPSWRTWFVAPILITPTSCVLAHVFVIGSTLAGFKTSHSCIMLSLLLSLVSCRPPTSCLAGDTVHRQSLTRARDVALHDQQGDRTTRRQPQLGHVTSGR